MTSSVPSGTSDPSEPITRTFPGQYASLASIGQFIRTEARRSGLDDTAIYQVEMAVDEACSNIIEHAYNGEGIGKIDCTCTCQPDGLLVVLKDTGQPFLPEQAKKPNVRAGLDDREPHGLGLFFIHEWMDQVRFERTPAGNVLSLFKSRASSKTGKKKTGQ